MVKKKKWLELLEKLGVILAVIVPICGTVIFLFEKEIGIKNATIDQKNAMIDQLKLCQFDNAISTIKSQKELYESELVKIQEKIENLDSTNEQNIVQIKIYKLQVIELQTKINVINQLSSKIVKDAEDRLGHSIKYTEVVPFSFYKLPDESNSPYIDSLFKNLFAISDSSYIILDHYRGDLVYYVPRFLLKGKHSPIFYSFDSVDLRTATFRNTDLRGVDLTKSIVDSRTKFPSQNK